MATGTPGLAVGSGSDLGNDALRFALPVMHDGMVNEALEWVDFVE